MDKNNLKVFARQLRNRLREMTEVKINYYLTGEDIEIKYREKQIGDLKKEIDSTGMDGVIEKVSYIWFNRFVALRFMELKGYTKSRILSPLPGRTVPEILEQVKGGLIDEELRLDRNKINDLLDGKIKSRSPEEEVYRMLVTGVCNYYHKIMPFMFEWIDDYTELLIPENLLKVESVRDEIVKNISEDDCKDVEIIGWLYQYYISEKKDEVFSDLKKNIKISKKNIPAATQLFTPAWIVKYMVENSAGRLWLEAHPDRNLQETWKYYIEPAKQEIDVQKQIEEITDKNLSPEDIKILDPCMGSGHILIYAFELLYEIYRSAGYPEKEIAELILTKNLYGLDIDDRAAQLASFALMMKARGYNRRIFRKKVEMNLCAIQEFPVELLNASVAYNIEYSTDPGEDLFSAEAHRDMALQNYPLLQKLCEKFIDGKEYGSLINIADFDVREAEKELERFEKKADVFSFHLVDRVKGVVKQAIVLTGMYDVVVTNPPYMGSGNMNAKLTDFVKKNFSDTKSDLFSCFIERGFDWVKRGKFNTMVTMQSWMFLNSFEKMRLNLLNKTTIVTMAHMANMVLGIAFGTATTVFRNISLPSYKGSYSYTELKDINDDGEPFEFPVRNERLKVASAKDFSKIPGSPVAYWVSERMIKIFGENNSLGNIVPVKEGLNTGNNDLFLRFWYEVNINKIGFNCVTGKDTMIKNVKWVPCNKGGEFRRWYGNNEHLINWENDGFEIKNHTQSTLRNEIYYFKKGITWSGLTTGIFSCRCFSDGFIFNSSGRSIIPNIDLLYITGLLNSKVTLHFLQILAPTFNFTVGNISSIPYIKIEDKEKERAILKLVAKNTSISKIDWDSFETSWDFDVHPLIKYKSGNNISTAFNTWKSFAESQFHTLHRNEEELNRIFIEIYGLQDELTPDVELKDITILRDETFINDRGELEFRPEEVMKHFISYSLGCIFGRYSPDKEGLILANQGETVEDYMKIINQTPSFIPDKDNILPVLSDEYFENDIVSLFNKFLKVTFGEDTFHENLAFIEEKLGKSIRAYFEKDFYTDHVKRYKKRPIYWIFQSPKKYFQALIYMHRYTPDLCSKVLNEYLREYASKQEYRKVQIKKDIDSDTLSGKEKTKKDKEIKEINKILKDLAEYDKKLDHMAKQYIPIDLDDGVRVNYCKFKDVLAPISGLEKE